jgi:hypothetical protein
LERLDGFDERVAVADLRDDFATRLLDEPGDSFANERRVLGDDDPKPRGFHVQIMREGSTARIASDRSLGAFWRCRRPPTRVTDPARLALTGRD